MKGLDHRSDVTGSLKPGFGIPPSAVIGVEDAHKYYELGETRVHAFRGVSIEIHRGEFVAIIGASGSGKAHLHEHPRLPGPRYVQQFA